MKVTKYWNPKVDAVRHGPQTSVWTSSKGYFARLFKRFGNETRVCFPSWHDSYASDDKVEKRGTIFWNLERLGWPRRLWMRREASMEMQASGDEGDVRWWRPGDSRPMPIVFSVLRFCKITDYSSLLMNNSALYMNARLSALSLTYYAFCLRNGTGVQLRVRVILLMEIRLKGHSGA